MMEHLAKLNKKLTLIPLAIVMTLMCLGHPIAVEADTINLLEGKIINGTVGGEIISDMVVTLDVIHDGVSVDVAGTLTNTEGRFVFENIDFISGAMYTLSCEYRGVVYKAVYDESTAGDDLELVVYEDTIEMTDLYVVGHSLILRKIDSSEKLIQVLEMVTIENHGSRSFVPDLENAGPMNLLRFSLPDGAANLDVRSSLTGGTILQINVGFAMNTPIPPGIHEIIYTYIFPYQDMVKKLSPSFPLGADTFRVLVETGLAELKVDDLAVKDPITLEGMEYKYFEGYELEPGSRVEIELHGLYQPSALRLFIDGLFTRNLATVVVPSAFGLWLAGALAYLYVAHRRKIARGLFDDNPMSERQPRIEMIAHLDDRFQAGHINQSEYESTRKEMKNKILDMDAESQKL